jgi:hypothetical protein
MENQELHAQKVTILSRLIKENYLSLEEALLLLKDEEPKQSSVQYLTSSGTAIFPNTGSSITRGINYPSFISTTGTSFTNTAVDNSADLNT